MVKYIKGDLFSHKPVDRSSISILAHACNARGSWGAGVARIFQHRFPSAYDKYVEHCQNHSGNPSGLLGTTYLIPSSPTDPGNTNEYNFYIACLFTSDFAGRKKLGPKDIVHNTDLSINDLKSQIKDLRSQGEKFEETPEGLVVNMPKINAGLFNVPWEDTELALSQHEDLDINVYVLE